MKRINYYIPWAAMYGICAGLALIPDPTGFWWWLCLGMSLLFFVPPAMILAHAIPRERKKDIALVRNLSLASLTATLVVLILNFVSVNATQIWGDLMHGLLILVSVPMVCSRFWFISLFCWACLLMVCLQYGGKQTKKRK